MNGVADVDREIFELDVSKPTGNDEIAEPDAHGLTTVGVAGRDGDIEATDVGPSCPELFQAPMDITGALSVRRGDMPPPSGACCLRGTVYTSKANCRTIPQMNQK